MSAGPGRRALVMGLGRFGGGAATARYLAGRGDRVTVTDAAGPAELAAAVESLSDVAVEWSLGGHRPEDFRRAQLVVANPAVRPDHPMLALAREQGARVTSELELFLEAVPAQLVLVTGTQGKSSTCHLTAGLLRAAGQAVHLGGNIGRSLLGEVPRMGPEDVCVLEVSSYQLEALPAERLAPLAARGRVCAAALTNLRLDHLERHGSPAAYAAAKARLLSLAGPKTTVLLPGDDPRPWSWPTAAGRRVPHWDEGQGEEGLLLSGGVFAWDGRALGRADELRLPGRFQRRNALLALGLAACLGAPPASLAAGLGQLRGLEHRLEDLGRRAGHRVWDNGVSTTPDSTVAALRALEPPLTLLLGGQAKNLPLGELARETAQRARRAVAFGRDAGRLARALGGAGATVSVEAELPAAVRRAFAAMERDECLLFSPACASFDAYPNFRERALAFRAALPPEDEEPPTP